MYFSIQVYFLSSFSIHILLKMLDENVILSCEYSERGYLCTTIEVYCKVFPL